MKGITYPAILTLLWIGLLETGCSTNDLESWRLTEAEIKDSIAAIIQNIEEPVITGDTIELTVYSGHKPEEDSKFNFQPHINRAIEELSNLGGGWLHISADQPLNSWIRHTKTYIVDGPVHLRSNVGILIDRSVVLYFPFNPPNYLVNGKGVLTRYEGTTIYSFSPLFRAFNAENIVIKSNGSSGALPVIDGDGEKWQDWMNRGEKRREENGLKPSYQLLKDMNNQDIPIQERVYTDPENDFFRPEMMEFFLCKNILVDGIKITNSPFWCVKPVFSESCVFRNIEFSAYNVNNDGIDPESSKNILIENVMFGNHDDNVAIKAGRDKEGRDGAVVAGTELERIESEYINDGRIAGSSENIVIRNCHFSGHHALCIGSEMSGGVRNVYAVDNYSVKEVNMGLFIKGSRYRGGEVSNVYVENLILQHTKSEVVALVPNYDKADDAPYPPRFMNIQLNDVHCNSSGKGILIHGWQDMPVENVYIGNSSFSNIAQHELIIEQSLNIVLDDIVINGEAYNKSIHRLEKGKLPPGRH